MLVSKHYNRLAAIPLSPAIESCQYQELNQDANFSIVISAVWEPPLSPEINNKSGSGLTFHSNRALLPHSQRLQKTSDQNHIEVIWSHKM